MADSLAKISGTLQSLSGEELARQQGLSAAPPTPLGAQGIGASQDVAKMAGTPNQVRAMVQDTLKERLRTSDLLQESERNGARKRFTVESLQEKMNALEGLGSLGGRIPEKIKQSITQAQTLAIPNSVNAEAVKAQLSTTLKQTVTDAEVSKAVAALQKLQSKDASVDDTFNALKTLGISVDVSTDASRLATLLAPFYNQADVNDIAKAMSEKLGAYAKVTMADLPDLYKDIVSPDTDIQDIPAILGISDDAFSKMTLSDVRAQLKAWKSRNFQDVDALRGVLDNPSYSMSEKDYARKRLAELGAVGVTSIEQKTDKLDAQIAEGDTVVVGGQAVRVSELMSDPKLKATISNALSSPEELTKLQSTDPGLATWITTNKNSLVAVQDQLREGTQTFAANQKEFSDKLGEDATVYSKLFDSIMPGWSKAKNQDWATWSTELAKSAPTFAAILNEPPSTERSLKWKVLESLPAEAAKTFSTASISSIVASAKGDATKAAQFAKDWYDSSQSIVTGITTKEALKDITMPTFDADFPEADFNKLTEQIIEVSTGNKQSLDAYIGQLKNLSAGTPEQRSEAMRMYRQLGDISRLIKTKLSPTNVTNIKQFAKTKNEKQAIVTQKKNELKLAQEKSSLTPKPIQEVLRLLPEQRDHLLKISESFGKSFGGIGNDMRHLLAGGIPERFGKWAARKKGAKETMVDGVIELDTGVPTLDDLILFIADSVRGKGSSYSGYSAASWASERLFSLRDELESQNRTQAAALTSEINSTQAEANQAKSNYDIYIKGLLST